MASVFDVNQGAIGICRIRKGGHNSRCKGFDAETQPELTRCASNIKSKIRSRVEYVFAEQKSRIGMFIRTIGIDRATTKIGMANILYNTKRLIYLDRIAAV